MSRTVRTVAAPRRTVDVTEPEVPRTSADLRVDVGGVTFANPITTASGCFASGQEVDRFFDVHRLGAIVVKSITLEPREGLPTPRMAETPSGMLNAIGLQNPGIEGWLRDDYPWLQRRGVAVIASIAGKAVDDYRQVARHLASVRRSTTGGGGLAAVEVNISCPNVEDRNVVFACKPGPSAAVLQAVREELPELPLLAKLTPDVTDITEVAGAVLQAGATGLSLINTTLGMAIDPETGRPRLRNTYGGMSGPAVRPIAVRAVHQVHRAHPDAPIIGMGGVRSVEDVVEMVRAGASMVAVGTATFANPFATVELLDALGRWLDDRAIASVAELRGAVEPW